MSRDSPAAAVEATAMTAMAEVSSQRLSAGTLFVAFSQMALVGFGGVLPFAYRAIVERRRWLSDREFGQYLAFSQMLPGPTICNMSVLIGWRFNGLAGALAAFGGMVIGPMVLVIVLGLLYAAMADHPLVRHALAGMSAVAAGLVIATAVKMALGYVKEERRAARDALVGEPGADAPTAVAPGAARSPAVSALALTLAGAFAFAGLAFVGVGLLRWPLIAVAAGLAPPAIAAAWLTLRRGDGGASGAGGSDVR